jgi:hypothetical protein
VTDRSRPEIGPALAAAWRHSHAARADLRAWQDARLRRLMLHAYEAVPHYRRLFDKHRLHPRHIRGTVDLDLIPFTDKALSACWREGTIRRRSTPCTAAARRASRSSFAAPGWRTSSIISSGCDPSAPSG